MNFAHEGGTVGRHVLKAAEYRVQCVYNSPQLLCPLYLQSPNLVWTDADEKLDSNTLDLADCELERTKALVSLSV